jgi:hypothetical protein
MLYKFLDASKEGEAFLQAEQVTLALRKLERSAQYGNTGAAMFLKRCVWPHCTHPMEMLSALEEAAYQFIPQEIVYAPLVKQGRSFSSTWIVEKAIGVEKTAMRCSTNDKCGQKEMWQALQTSSLLKDLGHQTTRPTLDQRAHSSPSELKGAFKADAKDTLVTEDEYLALASDDWYCPSADLFRHLGPSTDVLLKVGDAPDAISQLWQSLMLRPRALVQIKDDPKHPWVVVNSWADASLLWQLQPKTAQLTSGEYFRWLEFQVVDSHNLFRVEPLINVSNYRVSDAEVYSSGSAPGKVRGRPSQVLASRQRYRVERLPNCCRKLVRAGVRWPHP